VVARIARCSLSPPCLRHPARIEEENLDGITEAVEVREVLERVQDLSLEVSEELDAFQQRHGG
jgi:hypothetical protein